jgi:hypothetical protein
MGEAKRRKASGDYPTISQAVPADLKRDIARTMGAIFETVSDDGQTSVADGRGPLDHLVRGADRGERAILGDLRAKQSLPESQPLGLGNTRRLAPIHFG